jgi:transposase
MAQVGYQSDPLRKRLSKKNFIELHHNQGVSQVEIARRFNVSVSSLIRLKKQYDVPTNKNIKKLQSIQQREKVSLENQTLPNQTTLLGR